jgi:hypothetical protein
MGLRLVACVLSGAFERSRNQPQLTLYGECAADKDCDNSDPCVRQYCVDAACVQEQLASGPVACEGVAYDPPCAACACLGSALWARPLPDNTPCPGGSCVEGYCQLGLLDAGADTLDAHDVGDGSDAVDAADAVDAVDADTDDATDADDSADVAGG